MPTYQNTSGQRVVYNNTIWQAGETKAVQFFAPAALTALVKTSDAPPVLLFVVSQTGVLANGEDVEFEMPALTLEEVQYMLNVTCPETGKLEVYINDETNKITLDTGWGVRGPYMASVMRKVIIKGITDDVNTYTILVEHTRLAPNVIVE